MGNSYQKCTRCGKAFLKNDHVIGNVCPDCKDLSSGRKVKFSELNLLQKFWYLLFPCLAIGAVIVKFVMANLEYVISIGVIVIACVIVCLILSKKAVNPKKKIFITIFVSIVLIVGSVLIISNTKSNIQLNQDEIEKVNEETLID